jgi:hypothetical protein
MKSNNYTRLAIRFFNMALICIFSLSTMAIDYNVTNETCNGKEDGEIDLVPPTGNGPYQFSWSNGESSEDIQELAKGTYTVTITDKDQCEVEISIVVDVDEDRPKVSIKGGGTKTFCEDDNSKEVTLFAAAIDCMGCQYKWSDGSSGTSITVSQSGLYTVEVTDEDECSESDRTQVTIKTKDCDDDDDDDDDDDIDIPIIRSSDPNDIIGPLGVGDQKWVALNEVLPYTIRFENDPDFASAPAQKVIIRHSLSPNVNIFSFRLSNFGFGDFAFDVPPGSIFYQDRLDVTDSLGVLVDIIAGIDVTKKEAFWIFESTDPTTGLVPSDASLGFLLVNDSLHRGEGFVSFTIEPNKNSNTEDSIKAVADIVFDLNESILTPEIFNTIDAVAPVSSVDSIPLLPQEIDSVYTMTVSAVDDYGLRGSGVRNYDLFVSTDAGFNFSKWANGIPIDSSFVFKGEPGKDYCIYSIAIDSAGNREAKTIADHCFRVKRRSFIEITLPVAGEQFCASTEAIIKWNGLNVTSFDIDYSTDGGVTYQSIVGMLAATDTTYTWLIPENTVSTGTAQIRIKDSNDATQVGLSELFTIHGLPEQPIITASGSTTFCPLDSVILTAPAGYQAYVWSNGATTTSVTIKNSEQLTIIVTDVNGCQNVSDITEVIVVDNEIPIVTAQADINQMADLGQCGAIVTISIPSAQDNCKLTALTNNVTGLEDASGFYPLGTTTVIWTATDYSGNVAIDSLHVTIIDDEKPTITPPNDIAQSADAGECGAAVTIILPTVSDNCGVVSVVNDYTNIDNASAFYSVGTTTVIWTITDANGNIALDSMYITITDVELPTITAPADITQTADAGQCEANITIDLPITGDNCSVATVINDYTNIDDASGFYPVGTTTVTWTVTDAHNNITTASMDVIVTDNELPTITPPANISQTANAGQCGANVTIDLPITSDNCSVTTVSNDYTNVEDASGFYPVGTTTVVWTVTDVHNNVITGTMDVTVTDNELPTIIPPANITQTANAGQCGANVTIDLPITSDNCSVTTVSNDYTNVEDASGFYPVGTTTVVWTVTDVHNNVITGTMDVTVTDDELPTITAPGNITQTADAGQCGVNVMIGLPITDDNCSVAAVINDYTNIDDASGFYPVGTTTVTWTVTDAHNNITTASMGVTVTDDELPVIVGCPADIELVADRDNCTPAISWAAPTAIDNCGITSFVSNYNPGDRFSIGTTVVNYIAIDGAGNQTQCQFSITVVPEPLEVVLTSSIFACGFNISCNGAMDGKIATSVAGGCMPYTYEWNNGQMTDTASDLGAGVYSVIVTDFNGTSSTASITLYEPNLLTTNVSAISEYLQGYNISCNGGDDGSAGITASGGCVPYTYLWSDGQTTALASNLTAGTYTVTTKGANGCSATSTVILTEPDPLSVEAGSNQTVYYGYPEAACAVLNATGAIGGVEGYTFMWSTGETTEQITVCPIETTVYKLTITDANNCAYTDEVKVCVVDVRCGNKNNKVQVCHVPIGNSGNPQNLCVSVSAVAAHLAHGDYLGVCGIQESCESKADKVTTTRVVLMDKEAQVEEVNPEIYMEAYPNPFSGTTIIRLQLKGVKQVTLKVYNLNGVEMATLLEGEVSNEFQQVEFTPKATMPNGIYIYRLITDDGKMYNKELMLLR